MTTGRLEAFTDAVIAIVITIINPTYMYPLYHTPTGHMLIYIGLGAMAFGIGAHVPVMPGAAGMACAAPWFCGTVAP